MDHGRIDALRARPVPAFAHLIEGRHVAASDGAEMDVISPIDGQVLTTLARGTAADMQGPSPRRARRIGIAAGRVSPLRPARKCC